MQRGSRTMGLASQLLLVLPIPETLGITLLQLPPPALLATHLRPHASFQPRSRNVMSHSR